MMLVGDDKKERKKKSSEHVSSICIKERCWSMASSFDYHWGTLYSSLWTAILYNFFLSFYFEFRFMLYTYEIQSLCFQYACKRHEKFYMLCLYHIFFVFMFYYSVLYIWKRILYNLHQWKFILYIKAIFKLR